MKSILLCVLLTTATLSAFAADGKSVSYKSGDETVSGLLYTPQGKGPFPALVLNQEWWGLDDWMKEQASKLADHGYVALAIDLYRGKVATTPEQAHELARVPTDRVNRDLLAASSYLRTLKNVDPAKVGDIGWCMGGGYALDLAIADPKLKAAVINYGHLAADQATLKNINAAILGIFGGQDRGITADDIKKFESNLKASGKTVEIHIFPDAGHGFENPINGQRYRADATKEAWDFTFSFLAKYLK